VDSLNAIQTRRGPVGGSSELQPDYLPLIQQRVQEAALPLIEDAGPESDQLEQMSLLEER